MELPRLASLLLFALPACSPASQTLELVPSETRAASAEAGIADASPDPVAGAPSVGTPGDDRFAPGGAVTDAQLANYHVAFDCSVDGKKVGTMTFALWTEAAPITARNFLRLCDTGFYDGLSFHRILRGFMVQGGDKRGDGSGKSPFGSIQGEMSTEPERQHGYGVLSMARFGNDLNSASCQFFLCCDESESVWNLDGLYASFGRLTSGVEALEAVANTPVGRSRSGEPSRPKVQAVIDDARVIEGAAPAGEKIVRPAVEVDLKGEPARVKVQVVTIPFKGAWQADPSLARTAEEARAAAESWVAHFGDEAGVPRPTVGDLGTPILLLNDGLRDGLAERKRFDLFKDFQAQATEIQKRRRSGEITGEEERDAGTALQKKFEVLLRDMQSTYSTPRATFQGQDAAAAKICFELEVGAAQLLEHNPRDRTKGIRVIQRME